MKGFSYFIIHTETTLSHNVTHIHRYPDIITTVIMFIIMRNIHNFLPHNSSITYVLNICVYHNKIFYYLSGKYF